MEMAGERDTSGYVDKCCSADVVGDALEGELQGMAEKSGPRVSAGRVARTQQTRSYVKSPVASLCFACSSVRKRVRVTMSVLIFSVWTPFPFPFALADMVSGELGERC